jgi:hypothetical protein
MSSALRVCISWCLILIVVTVALSQPAQNRLLLEVRLRSPQSNERIAALRELKQYPTLDWVRPVLLLWNKDPDADVRSSAGGVLYSYRTDAKLRKAFLDTLKKEPSEANAILMGVYFAGAKPDEQTELLDHLARIFEKRPQAVQMLMPVADFLGTRDDADAAKALTAMTKLAVYQKHFGFRRSVVHALINLQRREAVNALVELMADSDGEIQGDVAQYLTRLSGEPFGNNAKAWKSWWLARQSTFEFPPIATQKARQLVGVPTYYGIPVYAKKVIFVIDTSGSMSGDRITNAKAELRKTIEGLPGGTQFNIVAYNSTLIPWKNALQTTSSDAKGKATTWVNGLKANGATHTFDALRIALDQQPEAMYVLTDGKPTGGTLIDPVDILNALKQQNKYRRTTIHVIGLDPGPEKGVFSQFLQELAAQNWGQYRRVD